MSRESFLVILKLLQNVLTYRIEDDDHLESGLGSEHLTEEVFYEHLYVPLPEVEKELAQHLGNYRLPVLLWGKQGTGKTSTLGQSLRLLHDKLSFTLVTLRCTLADAPHFATPATLETHLRARLEFQEARDGISIYDMLAVVLSYAPRYLEQSQDSASQRLYTRLRNIYDDTDVYRKSQIPFDDWLPHILLTGRELVHAAVRAFESNLPLAGYVSLLSHYREAIERIPSKHAVVFCIDNIDSLLDSDSIHHAISLLVRADSIVGRRGRIVVASRPRTFAMNHRELVPLPDAGHNLYETVNIGKHLRAVIIPNEDEFASAEITTSDLTDNASHLSSSHWEMLNKRLNYVLKHQPVSPMIGERNVSHLMEDVVRTFSRSEYSCELVTGLANHSFRSFLISLTNFVESLVERTEVLHDADDIQVDRLLHLNYRSVVDTNRGATLYSQYCYFVGHDGGSLPGVSKHRLRLGAIYDLYERTKQVPYPDLVDFYILKCLDGCQVARYVDDKSSAQSRNAMEISEIVARLTSLGFSKSQILGAIQAMVTPDRWDLPVLDFADQGRVPDGAAVSETADVLLEARGWLLANVFPFRLHYWLGDLAATYDGTSGSRSDHITVASVIRVIDHVIQFAEIEIQIVLHLQRHNPSVDPLREYAHVTHFTRGWCFEKMLGNVRNFLTRLHTTCIVHSNDGKVLHRAIGDLADDAAEHSLNTLSHHLRQCAANAIESRQLEPGSVLRDPLLTSWKTWRKVAIARAKVEG